MKQLLVKIDENNGETYFEGFSCEVLQRGQLASLEQAFIEIGKEKAEKIIFDSIKKFTIQTVQKYNMFLISFARFRRKDIAEMLLKQLPERGFGVAKIIEWNEVTRRVTIEVKNSFESHNRKSERPVCIALSAIFAGAFEILFNKQCTIAEVQCTAMGGKTCLFEMVGEKD
ncbi:MAG: V4R domain-containing protein [archaeon]